MFYNNIRSFNGNFFFLRKGEGFMSVIDNYTSQTIISGTSDADSIYNSGDDVSISTAAGNDSVDNRWGNNVSINTGAGNDSVYSYGANVTMNGGAGNDTFSSYSGVGNVYVYKAGDGNDVIEGFNEDDTVLIENGTWTKTTIGSDVLLTVGNLLISLPRQQTFIPLIL